MPSPRQSGARRAVPPASSQSERRFATKAPRSTASGPRPPQRGDRIPIGAAVELARWGFGRLRATVADYPEEADAIDRVAAAVEAQIRGTNPKALDQLDETDLLTTASILITTVDPDPHLVDAIAIALDTLLEGVQLEQRGLRRAPRIVRHLFLVP